MTTENIVALLTLMALEIVLGIDNVIFITILADKLPVSQRDQARRLGIGLAVISRIILLFGIRWVISLDQELFSILDHGFTGRDLILLAGGMFLIGKSTYEIHEKLESEEHDAAHSKTATTLGAVLVQVMIVDVVFSLDSVITAVGISGVLWVMITAILVAAAMMIFFAGAIGRFVEKHPTMKILALSFLILIGSLLVIEGWAHEQAKDLNLKNYAYFAMAFSFLVEIINLRIRSSHNPVMLKNRPHPEPSSAAKSGGGSKPGGGAKPGGRPNNAKRTAAGRSRKLEPTRSKPKPRK